MITGSNASKFKVLTIPVGDHISAKDCVIGEPQRNKVPEFGEQFNRNYNLYVSPDSSCRGGSSNSENMEVLTTAYENKN